MSTLAFRSGNVDPVRVWKDTVAFSAFAFAAFVGTYLWLAQWSGPIPLDGSGMVVGKDFLNVWMMGREAFSDNPGRYYNIDLYRAAIQGMLGENYPQPNWSYPPVTMLAAIPFGSMPYLAALAAFMLAGLGAFLAAVRWRTGDWRFALALAVSPAAIICVNSGQFSFALTAILICAFALLDRRPVLAGVLIGLLAVKPHLALFLPVLLAFSGRWRAFAAAGVTTLALAGAAAALFGARMWGDYVTMALPVQKTVLNDPDMLGAITMPTVFMNLRQLGLTYDAAMLVQLLAGLVAATGIAWVARCRRNADPDLVMAFYFSCVTFGLPYILSFDTLPLAFAAGWLMARGKLDRTGLRIAVLVWWLPLLQMGFGALRIPGPGLVVAPLFAWWLFQQLRAAGSASPAPRPRIAHA